MLDHLLHPTAMPAAYAAIGSKRGDVAITSRGAGAASTISVRSSGEVSAAFNAGRTKTSGDFASVAEQSGIYAGAQGFGIKVAGGTTLTGAVIASEAEASRNSLSTGTLSATDLLNRESYKASSVNVGFGLGGNGRGGNVGRDARGNARTGNDKTPGSSLPAIPTPLGKPTATPPVALGASGGQSGTTASAIAPGAITITSGDAASAAVVTTIGRDTSTANAGALTAEFNDAKRAEIAEGFDATRQGERSTGYAPAGRAGDHAAGLARLCHAFVDCS